MNHSDFGGCRELRKIKGIKKVKIRAVKWRDKGSRVQSQRFVAVNEGSNIIIRKNNPMVVIIALNEQQSESTRGKL